MSAPIHVFVGPTLSAAVRNEGTDLVLHGPAAQGDVYRLVAERPLAIGIIDGYFERQPAVWHKEILWAMAQGVRLYGAASMGALRAAELTDFGMLGVGKIFQAFYDGSLTDDDEVAVVHADASFDYRSSSEAMVNMRATLSLAEQCGLLNGEQRAWLVARAKASFYPDRHYAALLEWSKEILDQEQLASLASWLRDSSHRVDRKAEDALELLGELRGLIASGAEPLRVPWTFHHTEAWEQVRRGLVEREAAAVAEPRLREPRTELELRARLRALEIRAALHDGYRPAPEDVARAAAEFCQRQQLLTPDALDAFLREKDLTPSTFERLMADEACVRRSRLVPGYGEADYMRDVERLTGRTGFQADVGVERAAE
jgi:hypothetical protein